MILGKSTITGWGAIRYFGPSSDVLLGVTIDVWTDDQCREYYGELAVHDSNLCLGSPEPEHSACNVSSLKDFSCGTFISLWNFVA